MKRRNFLKGAASLFALPTLPINALASVGASTSVSAPIATTAASVANRSAVDVAYIWCRQFVENKPDFTPKMLTQSLGFSEKIVEEVLTKMVKNQVIQPTLVKGVFQKIDSPFGSSIDFIDRKKLSSALDMKKKYAEFLDVEEMREEEINDVNDMIEPAIMSSTHAGISAEQHLAFT